MLGGAQRVSVALATSARTAGWQVVVLVPGPGPFLDRLVAAGVEIEQLTASRALRRYGRSTSGWAAIAALPDLIGFWYRLYRRLRDLDLDVLHVNDHRGMILAALPARIAHTRVIWHVHALERSPVLTTVLRMLADAVIVPARTVIPKLRGIGLRGAPAVLATPLLRSDIGPEGVPSRQCVSAIGRLHPDKGIDVLIRAVAARREELACTRFVIAGGPQTGHETWGAELSMLAESLGVDSCFEFLGETEDVAAVLARSTAFVQPAREQTEILPQTIVEAMAAALPVIASDVGGMADLVDGTTGVLVPEADVDALADALVRVLADRDAAARMGEAGRVRALEKCNTDRFTASILRIWTEVAERRRSKP